MPEIAISESQTLLLQLQREYRHLEINKKQYLEETQGILRTQQKTIEKLRGDNDMLRNDIANIMRSSNRPLTIGQQHDIHRLHEQREKYLTLIDQEKTSIRSIEEQMDMLKQKISHQRKSMGGVNATKENHYMIEKQIRILENRLEKALVKFNEAMAQHKTLRDKIDDLRRERVIFENLYRKMEKELMEKKKQMSEIIEVSNQAYETRDTYQMEIAAIEQANRKEQEEFEEQMVELGRLLDTELALPPATIRANNTSNGKTMTKTSTASLTKELHSSSGKTTNNNIGNNAHHSASSDNIVIDSVALERVQNFEDAFNKIKESTGITDVDELVRIFIKNEDHNFSLFNYVNEQTNEIEACEEQIQALRDEQEKLTQESGDDVYHHKQILRDLESKLQSTETLAEKYDTRCLDLQRVIELLKRGIQTIFELVQDHSHSVDIVITESNMIQYLGIIEQKMNALLEHYNEVKPYIQIILSTYTNATSDRVLESEIALTKPPNIGPGPKSHDQIHINPPRVDEYNSDNSDEDNEEETRPFTLEELKVRTLTKLQRKGQSSNARNQSKKLRGANKK